MLDPAQNHAFRDHYLEINVDLSRVLFIATANQLGTIHPALLDRMEIISLAGYTEEEKVHIARRYLVPRQLEEHGLTAEQVAIDDDAVRRIDRAVHARSRRAQPRAADRRRRAQDRGARGRRRRRRTRRPRARPWSTAASVPDYLGPAEIHDEVAFRVSRPGVATGVAWTESGGDVLFIEASLLPAGHGNITLTGQLGNVMQESARAAVSHIRAHAKELGVAADFLDTHDLHVHVPAGAIPKDGPSAGVTMATAIVSALQEPDGPAGRRDDRRDHAERPGAAGRRHPREGARRAAPRHQDVHPAGAQRSRTSPSCRPKCADDMRFVPVATLEEVLKVALPPEPPLVVELTTVHAPLRPARRVAARGSLRSHAPSDRRRRPASSPATSS